MNNVLTFRRDKQINNSMRRHSNMYILTSSNKRNPNIRTASGTQNTQALCYIHVQIIIIYSTLSSYPFCGWIDGRTPTTNISSWFLVRISYGNWQLIIILKPLLPTLHLFYSGSIDGVREREREKEKTHTKNFAFRKNMAGWLVLVGFLQEGRGFWIGRGKGE